MKRTLAAAVTAGVIMGLAGAARPAGPGGQAAPMPRATLRVVPGWTYQGSGKLAVITSCSQRGDLPVVGSKLLPRPVTLRKGHEPGDQESPIGHARANTTINLFCTRKVGKRQHIDSAAMKRVRILKVLGGFLAAGRSPACRSISSPT